MLQLAFNIYYRSKIKKLVEKFFNQFFLWKIFACVSV